MKDTDDYVRREIEVAKSANLNVIPLLIGRTAPPRDDEVPKSLAFLWDLNFATLQLNDRENNICRPKTAIDKALLEGHLGRGTHGND